MNNARSQAGFSLLELIVATGLLLVVSSLASNALLQITKHQQTIWNRTEMHSGIRGATELLQQEVGQAGLLTLPTSTVTARIRTATARAGSLTRTRRRGKLIRRGATAVAPRCLRGERDV